jgi:Tfp pilus assembly protein PilP
MAIRAAILVLSVLAISGCGGGATANQLEWCAENQAKVGRAALNSGLMDSGTDYTKWKQDNPDAYERACLEAFSRG